jgi:hypothetical protein
MSVFYLVKEPVSLVSKDGVMRCLTGCRNTVANATLREAAKKRRKVSDEAERVARQYDEFVVQLDVPKEVR